MSLPRVILITGKGGTGKSTVAGALSLALAARHRTIIADLDNGLTAARMLGAQAAGASNFTVSDNLAGLSLSPRAELEAFIERIVPLRMVARRMLKSHTFGYVTAALPGLEAFLMLERMRLLGEEAAARDGFAVVDAPATGTMLELLAVAPNIRKLAPAGALNRLAETVEQFLRDRSRFGVILTVRPEALALKEGLEALDTMRERLAGGYLAAVLNAVPAALFSAAEIARMRRLRGHYGLALQRQAMVKFSAYARARLKSAGVAVTQLPMLYTADFARAQLDLLSGEFERSGLL